MKYVVGRTGESRQLAKGFSQRKFSQAYEWPCSDGHLHPLSLLKPSQQLRLYDHLRQRLRGVNDDLAVQYLSNLHLCIAMAKAKSWIRKPENVSAMNFRHEGSS